MIGETLGHRYRLVRLLGRGGMGAVYEAEQRETRDRVAVKVLHSHLLDPDGEARRRFEREAEVARGIRSRHVARVLDAGSDEATGNLYLVTEYLDGEDLQQLLDRVGPLTPEGALRVGREALAGLCDAHEARVVHRDIKPANLFLAKDGAGAITVKILDFGIAKIRADPLGLWPASGLTTTGGLLGSPLYMSPEQVQSTRDVDHRTDLWSLGSVLYAALVGRAPHQHLASLGQLLLAVCASPAPRLPDVAPWVPPEVAEVVHRALEIRPEARFASAAEMLASMARLVPAGALLEEMLAPSGGQARPVSVSTVPPSPPGLTPGSVAVLGLDRTLHADEAGVVVRPPEVPGSTTLASGQGEPQPARSAVPAVGARAGGRQVTVDPRRLLGEGSELWSFSLDVHRHTRSLVARVWKALRRAGADVPPMTYGSRWVLVEPRTGRAIVELGPGLVPLTLEDAGIRPGTVLWVVSPAGGEGA